MLFMKTFRQQFGIQINSKWIQAQKNFARVTGTKTPFTKKNQSIKLMRITARIAGTKKTLMRITARIAGRKIELCQPKPAQTTVYLTPKRIVLAETGTNYSLLKPEQELCQPKPAQTTIYEIQIRIVLDESSTNYSLQGIEGGITYLNHQENTQIQLNIRDINTFSSSALF